ncbi:GNAT family N-acetyltransferase [Nocardioides terrisoli]|uniref:GNAT family N-acetyltransferase n=1 Tax=Nocardioides terrisoli TaxID=3388267 RepID=UPI00287B8B4E|nr:GNAT family N-acetyltransferase [Nocardioides marmorisolisilvae]
MTQRMAPAMDLETDRLRIRPWGTQEAARVLDIQSRPEVVKWLGDGPPQLMRTLGEARERITSYHRRSALPPRGFWAIEVRETGVVAGSVILLTLPNAEHDEVEIGWHLHPDSWGRGYATEAAAAVLARGFAHGLPEIFALTHTDNMPSQAVCRRIGMRDLGVREKWYDGPSQVFGLTAEEYAGRA